MTEQDEIKSLIEDAAKLLGIHYVEVADWWYDENGNSWGPFFLPLDPERGDLMKVAEAAELIINYNTGEVVTPDETQEWGHFTKGDHESLSLAVLRAASAVLKSRGEG